MMQSAPQPDCRRTMGPAAVHQSVSALVQAQNSERDGGRIKRQHHSPRTPLQRLIKNGVLPQDQFEALRDRQRRTDPVALLSTIRRCQGQLAVLPSGEHGSQEQSAKTARDLAAEHRSLEVTRAGCRPCGTAASRGAASPNIAPASAPGLIPFNRMWC
jgi:hypothetical protein